MSCTYTASMGRQRGAREGNEAARQVQAVPQGRTRGTPAAPRPCCHMNPTVATEEATGSIHATSTGVNDEAHTTTRSRFPARAVSRLQR